MYETLFRLLDDFYPLSDELKEAITEKLQFKKFKKKEFVLKEGEICDYLYFIEEGFFKSFNLKDGKEITQWFMRANDFIISVSSFYKRTKSYEYIQALEDSAVHFIHYNDLQIIYKNFPEFNITGRILTEHYYILSEERLFGLRKLKAEERYLFLLDTHPEIIRKASRTDIASYLGISLETLSRIKKKK